MTSSSLRPRRPPRPQRRPRSSATLALSPAPSIAPVSMFGKGSPKINLVQANMHKKLSPKISGMQKKKVSPKGLEKALVELLHEHNNECYRGQNGWSSESWNRIVKLFHEKFPHNSFTKVQIQDKEKELKRDYRALKETRQQSGVSWDDRLCMIVAEEPIWANIIKSFPRTEKFRNKSFPLFEALGELYDGQTAEGTMNFTSTQPYQPHVRQPSQPIGTQPSQAPITQPSPPPFTPPSVKQLDPPIVQSDDDDLAILNPPATTSVSKRGKRARTNDGKVDKRRQDGRVAVSEMMGRFLEMKEKQAEAEVEERARTNANENDFSLPMCIAVVDEMEDLSEDEKIDAFDIFKDTQNRAMSQKCHKGKMVEEENWKDMIW